MDSLVQYYGIQAKVEIPPSPPTHTQLCPCVASHATHAPPRHPPQPLGVPALLQYLSQLPLHLLSVLGAADVGSSNSKLPVQQLLVLLAALPSYLVQELVQVGLGVMSVQMLVRGSHVLQCLLASVV